MSGISIVAGLLFAMAVFLFQLRVTLGTDKRPGEDDYVLVDECMANTLWAILCGLALALFVIVGGAGKWIWGRPDRACPDGYSRRCEGALLPRDRYVPQAPAQGIRAHRDASKLTPSAPPYVPLRALAGRHGFRLVVTTRLAHAR